MNIIPKPHKLAEKKGGLILSTDVVMDLSCLPEDFTAAKLLKKEFEEVAGFCKGINKSAIKKNGFVILSNKKIGGEGYTLDITEENVHIVGNSSKGLFYGVQTLRQIVRQYGLNVPCVAIEDEPSVGYRGLNVDITRGRIPTKEYLFELIDRLAFYKINYLQFYIEHCFLFEGFSEVCTGKGVITPEEILELDEYAAARHIELIPSMATCGHLYEVLQTRSFNKYCEFENYVPTGHRWNERQQHHIIDISNKETHEFIKNLIDRFCPLFRSKIFNINLDEPFDLCKGRSSALAEEAGADNLYKEFTDEICNHLSSKGITPMFFADIFVRNKVNPRCFEKDNNIIIGYGSYDDIVLPKVVDEIAECGEYNQTRVMYCTTHSYSQILNSYGLAARNIKTIASYVKKYNYDGLHNTVWGDEGHACHHENSIPLIILGADLGWNYNQDIDMCEFMSKVSQIEYGDKSGELVETVYNIAEAQAKHVWDNRMPISFLWFFFIHLVLTIEKGNHVAYREKWIPEDVVRQLKETEKKVVSLKNKLLSMISSVPANARNKVECFINTAEGVRVISNSILALYDYPNTPSPKAAEELELWLMEYERIWRRDNKESELHEIVNIIAKAGVFIRDGKNKHQN